MSNRLTHLDVAKGIGIMLVVFGHNWIVLDQKGELFNVIYSFHIPLFFFLSGIFFNPNESLLSTMIAKADALLKPYFVTLIPVAIITYLVSTRPIPLQTMLWYIAYGSTIILRWEPLWFMPNLFIISIFA
jgi:fucose 4-O-acetylase-like acetyltransferase